MEVVIRPFPHACYVTAKTDGVSCTYDMDGFTMLYAVVSELGLDREYFRKCAFMHTGEKFRLITHGDEKPLVITTTKTELWDSEPNATEHILKAADAERCQSLRMTHFALILGEFPEEAFAQCLRQVERGKQLPYLRKVIVDVDGKHFDMARLIQRKITEADFFEVADQAKRSLILGLGTAAQGIVKNLQQDTVILSQRDKFVFEGVDSFLTGCDGSDFNRRVIGQLVNMASRALLVVFGGGKSGADMATYAVKEALAKGTAIEAIVSIPASWEGGRRVNNGRALVHHLRSLGAKVTEIESDLYVNEDDNDWRTIFSRVDAAMIEMVRSWCEQYQR